ncbi:MAG: ABC transporter substrate-binding protein [Sulfurovum sp.]|nr:ABC transporter substrate-binding protein [Sulfurovum sp.]
MSSSLVKNRIGGMVTLLVALVLAGGVVNAAKIKAITEKVDAIMIGDRIVDIAYHLGVMPVAMSIRGSEWPESKPYKVVSQILGCPKRVTVKSKERVPDALKKFGVKRIIVERNPQFCAYMPKVDPVNIESVLKERNVTGISIEYVDFSKGVESAIKQTAKLLGKEDKADALIEKLNKKTAKMKAGMSKEKLGKKVLILKGTYQTSTGKPSIRVEAPGGYADKYFLEPLGCSNVGGVFAPKDGKPKKGHFDVPKKRKFVDLGKVIEANPDVIVMTGDVVAVQKALAGYIEKNPELAKVPAIKNMAMYKLPIHIGSSIFKYPDMFKKWQKILSN